MKQLLLFFLLLITTTIFSQFNSESPWMKELKTKSSKSDFTLQEISSAFNQYWELHKEDKDKKGSGYKPFKRWENRWNLSLNKAGKIISNKTIWNYWEAKNRLNTSDISDWQNIGPFTQTSKSGQGRVNTIAVDPNNPNIYYVGAPAGGIWKSTNSGETWVPLSDKLPQIGVSGIAIDPNNSDTIYIATGDDDASDTYSVGVMKTIDGGTTWNQTGLTFSNSGEKTHEIYINPNNSNMLWVATTQGVYKTTNAGANWNIKLHGNIRDLKLKPNNPNVVYAVTADKFYKSTNFGDTFTQISTGLPTSSNRFTIDVTPANENLVYLLSANTSNGFQGVYKSTNSGNSFSRTAELSDVFGGSDQSWYDMALTVSDTDENIVFVGVLDLWKSTNGGDNFSQLNQWWNSSSPTYTHADIHFLRYFNNQLFCGSDGGIYKSINDGNNFNELNEGLAISQLYRIANARQSSGNIVGGLQDNGGFAYSNNTWHNYHGGDGMDCAVDPNNPNIYYGFTQYGGSLNVTYNGGVSGQGITGSPETGNWITPMTINSQGELYAGYSKLYKLVNSQWQVVSSDIFGGNLHRVEIDPNNSNKIFVARYNDLYKSIDKGVTFVKIYTAPDNISSVEINNDNGSIIYLTTSSGENGSVLKSTNGGNSFNNITTNLPNESKLIIKHQPHSPNNDLYVGSSLGVYHINDDMSNWETYATNLPNVPIRDLEINVNDAKIIAGTFGRSVWESPIEIVAPSDDIRLIEITNPNTNVQCGNSIIPDIQVKNQGLNIINQVSISYTIDNGNINIYNYNGTINSLETTNILIPEITGLSLGKHSIQINTNIANDAYSDNNNSSTEFYINQTDSNPTIVNPFLDSTNQWLIIGNENVWEIGQPTTTVLENTNSIGYTTVLNFNYPDNISSYLVSPCYNLTTLNNPILKFNMAFDLEQDYDVLYIEYTTDQGTTWNVLGTANDANWYNSDYDSHQLTIGKQWTGTDSTLKEYSHNLSFLTSENQVSFRFAFLTDQSMTQEGVIIDDFVIEGSVAKINDDILNKIDIYPNPSTGIFNIHNSQNKNIDLNVFDITGKLIKKESNLSDNLIELNLSNIAKGIYFIKLNIDNITTTKKIILK